MADVINIERSVAPVKAITVKLTTGEARDMQVFIEEWYRKRGDYYSAKNNGVYKAITDGLAGKTQTDVRLEKIFGIDAKPARVYA